MSGFGARKAKKLYIPHGSDESQSHENRLFFVDVFISHMVQMKAGLRMRILKQ